MNELTAQDLMLGDWVMYRGEPIIVYEIDEYYDRINTEPDGYNAITCVEISEVTPIPLTAEILEKNFTFDHYGLYFFGGDYHEVYIKECANGLWRVEADEIMSGLPTWKMFVSNLHELQHALRLAGIDKTIEL